MPGNSDKREGRDRRDGERRQEQSDLKGPDRRKRERRSGEDRRDG